jgi:CRISPR/Cas system CMR-associated protein Cmr5 small subunit
MAVAKKVRKSYEHLAFIEKARNESIVNGRYLSVGFNNQRFSKIDQDYSSSINMASMGKSTNDTNFKKSDASSFTQISSDF